MVVATHAVVADFQHFFSEVNVCIACCFSLFVQNQARPARAVPVSPPCVVAVSCPPIEQPTSWSVQLLQCWLVHTHREGSHTYLNNGGYFVVFIIPM